MLNKMSSFAQWLLYTEVLYIIEMNPRYKESNNIMILCLHTVLRVYLSLHCNFSHYVIVRNVLLCDNRILGCDVIQSGRSLPMFQRHPLHESEDGGRGLIQNVDNMHHFPGVRNLRGHHCGNLRCHITVTDEVIVKVLIQEYVRPGLLNFVPTFSVHVSAHIFCCVPD